MTRIKTFITCTNSIAYIKSAAVCVCVCVADYCTKMADGRYYDPWNPWCGYIVCRGEQAVRVVCRPGSWMGITSSNVTQMCRRPLVDATCGHYTDLRLCVQPAGLISHATF